MSKPKRERSLADNEAKAVARMLRVSPQKLNLVAQLIRGRKASAALADLQFSRKRIAVERVPTWRFVRFNWTVEPSGTADQRAVIEKAVGIVRTEHPYVI